MVNKKIFHKSVDFFSTDNVPFYDQNTLENWSEKGFLNEEEARVWDKKACGIACAKMVAEAFDRGPVPIGNLIREAFDSGAFKDGVGWIHSKIAEFVSKRFNLNSNAERNVSLESIKNAIESGKLIIASVGFGFFRGKNGHLIVVLGYEMKYGLLTGLYVHHPSTKKEFCMIKELIPIEKFISAFSGNIIKISKSK